MDFSTKELTKKYPTENESNQRRYSSFADNSRKNAAEIYIFFLGGEDRLCKSCKLLSRYSCSCTESGWSVSDAFCLLTAWRHSTFLRGIFLFRICSITS